VHRDEKGCGPLAPKHDHRGHRSARIESQLFRWISRALSMITPVRCEQYDAIGHGDVLA
jgi:hypothetical protein